MRDGVIRFFSRWLLTGVADAGAFRAEHRDRITLLRADSERVVPRDSIRTFSDLMALAEAGAPPGIGPVGERTFRRLVAGFFYPTIVPDLDLTDRRREQFRAGVDSIKYAVPAGERIVGARELVSPEVRDKLLGLRDALRRRGTTGALNATTLGGPFLYDAMVLAPFWLLIMLYRRETYRSVREMSFFAGLFSMVVLLTHAIWDVFPGAPSCCRFRRRRFSSRCSTTAASRSPRRRRSPSCSAASGRSRPTTRSSSASSAGRGRGERSGDPAPRRLYVTIAVMACAYALAAVAVGLSSGWTGDAILSSALAGLVAAIGTTAVGMLMLPLAESLTRITTDLTLLELADPARPLLRRLALEAPGTWAHSIAMANLCESACNAIRANGLLARVGCYYHDVGKLMSPRYFVENQARGVNPHDELPPEESAAIIRDHVEQGLRLADEHRLPPAVRDFIPEHHGTNEIRSFLVRARSRAPGLPIDAALYRYPGPRPRSAETAVVMLADSAEAAVRAIDHPTPETVRRAVDDVVAQRLASGQLDNAPLTLRDVDRVKEEFIRVIAGMYHARGEYPRPSAERPSIRQGGAGA
jgi:uncharacterized domain HDIG